MAPLRMLAMCALLAGVVMLLTEPVAAASSCASGLNYCYDASGTTLTCCVSTCDNCDLATGLPPASLAPGEFQLLLYTARVPTPSGRHGPFQEYGGGTVNIEDGFDFSLDFFTKLPSPLDNYTTADVAGVSQGRCLVTATGGSTLPFPPPSLECIQTFYFITSPDGTYQDSLGTRSLFLTSSPANTPAMITGGTGKYKYVQGEAQLAFATASGPGGQVYDSFLMTLKGF